MNGERVLDRMPWLLDRAWALVDRSEDDQTLEYATEAIAMGLASVYWWGRAGGGDAPATGLPPLSEDELAERERFFRKPFGRLDRAEPTAADIEAAVRSAVAYTYSLGKGDPKTSLDVLATVHSRLEGRSLDGEVADRFLTLIENCLFAAWHPDPKRIVTDLVVAGMAAVRLLTERDGELQSESWFTRLGRLGRFSILALRNGGREIEGAAAWRRTMVPALGGRVWQEAATRTEVGAAAAEAANLHSLEVPEREEAVRLAASHAVDESTGLGGIARDAALGLAAGFWLTVPEGAEERGEALFAELAGRWPETDALAAMAAGVAERLPGSAANAAVLNTMVERLRAALEEPAWRAAEPLVQGLVHAWSHLALDGGAERVLSEVEDLWDLEVSQAAAIRRGAALRGAGLLLSLLPEGHPGCAVLEERITATRGVARYQHNWTSYERQHDDALVEAAVTLAARRMREGASIENLIKIPGWSTMNPTAALELDKRIGDLLSERLDQAVEGDLDAAWAIFAQLAYLCARSPVASAAAPLCRLLERIAEDDPRRAQVESLRIRSERAVRSIASEASSRQSLGSVLTRFRRTLDESLQEPLRVRAVGGVQTEWPFPPPFPADWREVPPEDLPGLLEVLLSALPRVLPGSGADLIEHSLRARRAELSFYAGWCAAEVLLARDQAGPASVVCLVHDDHLVLLDGTSPPIHQLNARKALSLATEDRAEGYLRFFCGMVHGPEGPFRIVDSPEDVASYGTPEGAETLDALGESIVPLDLQPDEDGQWATAASILYSNALFRTQLRILPEGMIEMNDDEPIAADLPVWQERIVNGLRERV